MQSPWPLPAKAAAAADMFFCLFLCRFYGASGEEIISIGADVHRMTEPLHATAAQAE
jgi:hypothetical protein